MAAYQILFLFCAAVLCNTALSLHCYKCTSNTTTCFERADSYMTTEKCLPLISKCIARQVLDIGHNVTTFTRGCHANVLGLGVKTGCTDRDNKHTCQMVCSDDKCNDLSSTNLETCASHGSCNSQTIHTDQGLQCYKCETSQNTGQCVDAPDSSTPRETCFKGLSKCITQSETREGNLQYLKRSCHLDLFGVGAKDGCKTEGGLEICKVVCDNTNLCNSRAQSDMENCAKEGGCNTDIQCYKCETSQETDQCVSAPDSSLGTETCLGGGECMTQRQINKENNDLVLFKRGCIRNIGVHVNDGCTTMNNIETCTTVCSQANLCNNQTQTRMEKTGRGFAKSVYIMFMEMIDNNIALTINT